MADDTLLDAAGRIADGEQIDWASITSSLPSDDQREVADELAVLAQIAAGHRQLHQLLPVASDTPSHLMPDRARWGHLDLLNIVGRGSYGTVYRAWDTRLERLVALKLFHGVSDPDVVMQEGRMLARVRHENVVTVYGADVVDGVAGLWMELVHGETLEHLVKARGPMTAIEAATLSAEVAKALGAVHSAGLLHCDIKAQNVVQESGGRVVLMDLGAGQVVPEAQDSDQLSDVAGTPRYMAPELFQAGATATKSTDIYSFGVLLYYLVSGGFPVDGKSLGELKLAHYEWRANTLDRVRPGLPLAFLDLVSRAIDRDPAQRPSSAADVESALAAIAAPMAPPAPEPRSVGWWAAVAAVVGLLALVLVRPLFTPAAPPAPEVRSIAVLPIKNLTGDPSKAYIADGLTQELITNLAGFRSLRVPSFEAVASLGDNDEPPDQLSKKLGSHLLLAGAMVQSGSQLRLTLRMTDSQGKIIWSDAVAGDHTTILSAPGDITRALAGALNLAPPVARLARKQPFDARAQTAYFRGLFMSRQGLKEARESVQLFREAIEIEPEFAAAWAEMALAESIVVPSPVTSERAAQQARIRAAADRAIALDPLLATGHAALANEQFYFEWDFPAAERMFRQALNLDPNHAFAGQRLAMLLAAVGRVDEAITLARESQALEPLYAVRTQALAILYYYRRDFDNAVAQMRHALELSPGFPAAHYGLGRIYSAMGRQDAAAEQIELALKSGRISAYLVELARIYAVSGDAARVGRLLTELSDRERQGDPISADRLGYLAASQGRVDDAFGILEAARDRRSPNLLWLAVDPRVDSLRSDARFPTLLRSIGLIP